MAKIAIPDAIAIGHHLSGARLEYRRIT